MCGGSSGPPVRPGISGEEGSDEGGGDDVEGGEEGNPDEDAGDETPIESDTEDTDAVVEDDVEVVEEDDATDIVEDDVDDVTEDDDVVDVVEEEDVEDTIEEEDTYVVVGCQSDEECEESVETSPCEMAVCMPDNTCLVIANEVPDCCESLLDCDDGNAVTVDSCPGPGQSCTHTPDGTACPQNTVFLNSNFDDGTPQGWTLQNYQGAQCRLAREFQAS